MYSSILSGGICGGSSFIARVEVDLAKGLPCFDMVGRLSKEVTEAKERVKVVLKNSYIDIPPLHITVNISPANLNKSGTGFDLPIAIGVLAALEYIPTSSLERMLVIGELGLDGSVCPVSGILPIVSLAKTQGIETCLLPKANAAEASYIEGIKIIKVESFEEALAILLNPKEANIEPPANLCKLITQQNFSEDFAEVAGQDSCKRAALIAAAGNHHLMISGPPGSGKTMIARRLRTIMPALSHDDMLEISSIYSIAGKLDEQTPLITKRPFQSPHHASTLASFVGDRRHQRPGILSLCHKGILFLDEFPEFPKECIEMLREPLETKSIVVSRALGTYTYPADFLLVTAANPCPCGYYPDKNKCNCSETQIRQYKSKISGPIKDRIDITVTAHKIEISHLSKHTTNTNSASMREQVLKAIELQKIRFANKNYKHNSEIPPKDIEQFCHLGEEEVLYVSKMYDMLDLSARSYHKLLRVARTIADLDDSVDIKVSHLAEAVCYRG